MSLKITVLIVDDHPLFRQGLAAGGRGRFTLRTGRRGGRCRNGLATHPGKETRRRRCSTSICRECPVSKSRANSSGKRATTQIIILTMYKEEETFNRALGFGVRGFVLKENAVENSQRLVAVSDGEHYLSPSISGYLVRRQPRPGAHRAEAGPRRSDQSRAAHPEAHCRKEDQPANRGGIVHQPAHGRGPSRQHLRQARPEREPQPAAIRARESFVALTGRSLPQRNTKGWCGR